MNTVKNFWLFTVWFAVILYLSFTPLTGWPKVNLFQKLYFDKLVHISMYALLSFFLLRSFFKLKNHVPSTSTVIGSVLFCMVVGASIEFLQPVLTMYRQFEWLDMVANAIGSLSGYLLFVFLMQKQWIGIKLRHELITKR
jgi:VanZ family protein